MSEFTRVKSFPHICNGTRCAICRWVKERAEKAAADAKKPILIEENSGK